MEKTIGSCEGAGIPQPTRGNYRGGSFGCMGSQSWLQPPFRRPLQVRDTRGSVSVVERGAASKGGCSQDWLPHVAKFVEWRTRVGQDRTPMKTIALAVASLQLFAGTAYGDEIRVMTSGAFTAAYLELIPRFERATGNKIVTAATSMGTGSDSIPSRLQRR